MLFSLNWTILIELILIFKVVFASSLYCVHHDSQSLKTCQKSHTISAAVADTPLIDNKQQLSFDLFCTADPNECASVRATLQKAMDILSSVFQFESSLRVNATYGPFCPSSDNNCSAENRMSAIGQAYPTISYIMVDQTDNMTRLYPQALLKQFTNLSVKPNWAYYDINAEFNSQVNWYFFVSVNYLWAFSLLTQLLCVIYRIALTLFAVTKLISCEMSYMSSFMVLAFSLHGPIAFTPN